MLLKQALCLLIHLLSELRGLIDAETQAGMPCRAVVLLGGVTFPPAR
jgi:hypothetical protein